MATRRSHGVVFGVVLGAIGLLLLGAGSQELVERRTRIERMTPAEKAELARKEERFARLSPEKQALLRELHQAIDNDPDGEALREVLRGYCDWLDTLLSNSRSDLKNLPVEQRVEQIKKRWYQNQDDEVILEWGKTYFAGHGFTPQKIRENLINRAKSPQRFNTPQMQKKKRQEFAKVFHLEGANLEPLLVQLSPARQKMLKRKTPEGQRHWVADRLRKLAGRAHFMRGMSRVVSDEELAKFFESNAVPESLREELLRLPGNEMRERLLQMYRWSRRPPSGERGPRRPNRGSFRDRSHRAPPGEGANQNERRNRRWKNGSRTPPVPPEDR